MVVIMSESSNINNYQKSPQKLQSNSVPLFQNDETLSEEGVENKQVFFLKKSFYPKVLLKFLNKVDHLNLY